MTDSSFFLELSKDRVSFLRIAEFSKMLLTSFIPLASPVISLSMLTYSRVVMKHRGTDKNLTPSSFNESLNSCRYNQTEETQVKHI